MGRPLTACVTTFGCQMNARDSEKLIGILKEIGFEESTDENSDFVLYNTCTVRENANLRVYGRLGHLNSLKKQHPGMIIALCGCMMQEETVVEKIRKSYRFVDLIFGTHNIFKLAELLYQRMTEDGMVVDVWKDTDQIVEDLPVERKYPFKSGVNIMFGCNNFCTYCIVPYVRGRAAQPCAGGHHQRDRRSCGGRCCGGDALRSECKFLWQDAEPAGQLRRASGTGGADPRSGTDSVYDIASEGSVG